MSETTYKVQVKTGSKGTNADIEIFLFGTKGTWTEFRLMDNPGKDDFEPNRTDIFTFIDDNDIGIITDIAIRPRGAGLYHDNWKMDSIKIKSDATNSKETNFKERKRLFKGGKDPIMLRAEKFSDINIATKTVTIPIHSYIIAENNFGGLAMTDRTVAEEIITKDNLKVINEHFTSLKQSYELKIGASLDGLMDISSTHSGEIASTFKKEVTSERETIEKKTKSFKYAGIDHHCNFFIFTEYEVKVVGKYDNPFLKSTKLEQAIKKHTIVEVKSFKAVDQNLPGSNKTFQQLWQESSKPDSEMPKSPTLAELANNKGEN